MIKVLQCEGMVRELAVIIPYLNKSASIFVLDDMRNCVIVHAENLAFGGRCAALDHDDKISVPHDYDNNEMMYLSVSCPAMPSASRPPLSCTFFTAVSRPNPKIPGVSIP